MLLENVSKYFLVDMVLTTYHNWVPDVMQFQCVSPNWLAIWYVPLAPPTLLHIVALPVGVACFTLTLRCIVFFVLFYVSLILTVLLYSRICSGGYCRSVHRSINFSIYTLLFQQHQGYYCIAQLALFLLNSHIWCREWKYKEISLPYFCYLQILLHLDTYYHT